MLNQVSVDKDLLKQRYNTKIVKKQEQLSREFKDKWKIQENEFEVCVAFLYYLKKGNKKNLYKPKIVNILILCIVS